MLQESSQVPLRRLSTNTWKSLSEPGHQDVCRQAHCELAPRATRKTEQANHDGISWFKPHCRATESSCMWATDSWYSDSSPTTLGLFQHYTAWHEVTDIFATSRKQHQEFFMLRLPWKQDQRHGMVQFGEHHWNTSSTVLSRCKSTFYAIKVG